MNNFTLYELSTMANAIEQRRKSVQDDYSQQMNHLDRISLKLRQQIDNLTEEKAEHLTERGFFVGLRDDEANNSCLWEGPTDE
jgi:hypothetical protein